MALPIILRTLRLSFDDLSEAKPWEQSGPNAVRLVMLEAAAGQQASVDRIVFADAPYWVRHGDLTRPLPQLTLVPYRPGRVEPRLKKRRNDRFGLLTRPRQEMRKASPRRSADTRFSAIKL